MQDGIRSCNTVPEVNNKNNCFEVLFRYLNGFGAFMPNQQASIKLEKYLMAILAMLLAFSNHLAH